MIFDLGPTAYDLLRLKPRHTKQSRSKAAKTIARKWAFFCAMASKWTAGYQLEYLRSMARYCQEECIDVPDHLSLWIRIFEVTR